MSTYTESEFRKLPVEQQNALVANSLGTMPRKVNPHWEPKAPLYVNGDGNAFFEMWDALPLSPRGGTTFFFHQVRDAGKGGGTACVRRGYVRPRDVCMGSDLCAYGDSPNLAVALALLKALGVVKE